MSNGSRPGTPRACAPAQGQLGGYEHETVAGHEGANLSVGHEAHSQRAREKGNTDHGTDSQPDGIVEGTDGEYASLGLLAYDGAKGRKVKAEGWPLGEGPLGNVVIGNLAVADGRVEFEAKRQRVHEEGEARRTRRSRGADNRGLRSEVQCKGLLEAVVVVLEEVGELKDLGLACLDGPDFAEAVVQVRVNLAKNTVRFFRSWTRGITDLRNVVDGV